MTPGSINAYAATSPSTVQCLDGLLGLVRCLQHSQWLVLVSVAFVSVLSRSPTPIKLDTDDAAAIMSQLLKVSRASTPTAIMYNEFLRVLRDCNAPSVASMTQVEVTNQSIKVGDSPPSSAPTFAITNVADYLIHNASEDERRHFEELMEMLHRFQQRIEKQAGKGMTVDLDDMGTSQAGAILPIENGIMMALGGKLKVRIQFTT